MSIKELNSSIKALVEEGSEIKVGNPGARHNTIVGIFKQCKITVEGSVGYYSASLLDGPEITVEGNAGWALGDNMMSGKIVVKKDAGASVGSSIRGGEIFIGGNAGARAGISMKGGTLIINGTDAPVEPISPIASYYASVSRKTLNKTPIKAAGIIDKIIFNEN